MSTGKRFNRRTVAVLVFAALVLIGLIWDGSPLGSLVLREAVKAKFSTVRSVTPAELVAWRGDPNRPPALLVDARPEAEFTMSHIDGAVWIDPAAPDLSVIANVPKSTPVVVYDAAGTTAAAMAVALRGAGYNRVSYLEGGLFAWANGGQILVDAGGPAETVYPINWKWGRLLKSRYHP
ncbi:MAG TPA: rhodanese-like domain-containing protein [Gemmatimonadales bacterium]|nr:rhodanese-like domain-containing protein [Gemmatimonadales bacterium]